MSLKLAAIFKDFMVVQRNRPITVFGTGVPKTVVTVSLHTSFSKTVVAADGTWCATLPPLAAGTDYVLTARPKNSGNKLRSGRFGLPADKATWNWLCEIVQMALR